MKHRMKFVRVGFAAILLLQFGLAPLGAAEAAPAKPALVLREVKVTGDEFIVIQALAAIDHLSEYWLGYSSNNQLTNIVPTQQLPDMPLETNQAVLLTSNGAATCDAVYTAKLSPSLSDSAGRLELRHLTSDTLLGTSTFQTVDETYWSKPAKTAPELTDSSEMDLRQEATTNNPVWYRDPATLGAWQVGDFAGCTLTFSGTTTTLPEAPVSWLQSDVDPPAVIESLSDDATVAGPVLPLTDQGLAAPQITELLPNPAGTGNDATDEFIELYNPNAAAFDLTGFVLQTGLSTKRSYIFPAGTSLPPKSFVAFYSADTGLSLSNTGSQADVQDPFGTVIAQSDEYAGAKDGLTWALAKGVWYWTTHATPSAANVIAQAAVTSSKTKNTSGNAAAKTTAIKGAATAKPAAATTTASTQPAAQTAAPIHPGMLAAVVLLGVGYGIYEYRHDLANRIYQFRSNRAARRKARS